MATLEMDVDVGIYLCIHLFQIFLKGSIIWDQLIYSAVS